MLGNQPLVCQIGGPKVPMIIDCRVNLLSFADWQGLQRKGAIVLNIRTNFLISFVHAPQSLISIKANPEIKSTHYVIENGRQSLLEQETLLN